MVAVISIAILELLLVSLRHVPAIGSITPLQNLARELYLLDRNYLQLDPASIRWDPELGYTLRPGEFEFSNTEFTTSYRVNSLGLRDDEASLSQPEVVVVGDSFAMGWGVAQDDAFPQVLERLTGRRVLNAAVSSYGTVRELRMLARIDTTVTTWLVIQFCNNDFFENQQFAVEGQLMRPQPQWVHEAAAEDYRRQRRYWPGRYVVSLLGERWQRIAGTARRSPAHPDPEDPAAQRFQAQLLLAVLENSPVDLEPMNIVLFELNAHNRYRGLLMPALRDALGGESVPDHLKRMVVIDVAADLGPEHWYVLDDHLRPSGHWLLAERLARVIQQPQQSLPPRRHSIDGLAHLGVP
jgi:lysophospholipase L1-like esterase